MYSCSTRLTLEKAGVPDASKLPMGMQVMHDAYLFIYLVATFLGVLLARFNSPDITATESFRHDGLIRLYVGYLLFTLARRFSGGLEPCGNISFEHWYFMFDLVHVCVCVCEQQCSNVCEKQKHAGTCSTSTTSSCGSGRKRSRGT